MDHEWNLSLRSPELAIRAALGLAEGYIPSWRMVGGCQLTNFRYAELLTCPYREAVWRCEVIGPHTVHRWSDHLVRHERQGNGWSCLTIDRGLSISYSPVEVYR